MYPYITVDVPINSGGHFFCYQYFVIHVVNGFGQSDWIRIHNAADTGNDADPDPLGFEPFGWVQIRIRLNCTDLHSTI